MMSTYNRSNVPWWYKVVRLSFPELCENPFYSPCLSSLSLGLEHSGNAICQYVLSHYSIIRWTFSNRIYLPILPFSPPSVLFSTTKLTTEVFWCTLAIYVSEIQHPSFFILTRGAVPAIAQSLNAFLDIVLGDDSVSRTRENELQCGHKNDSG